jgi:enoyl-CoA hydratase
VDERQVEETARVLCRKLAGYSLVAVESVKASVRMALSTTLPAGLKYENEMNMRCFAVGDHMEGIRAFQQKQDAEFKQ